MKRTIHHTTTYIGKDKGKDMDMDMDIYTATSIKFNQFLSDEGSMLETLDYTIRIGRTPIILYFDLYLYSAYAAHYVYIN